MNSKDILIYNYDYTKSDYRDQYKEKDVRIM